MSLDKAMSRLSLRPASLCCQCRRAFASFAARRVEQNATAAFAELLQSSRSEAASPEAARARAAPATGQATSTHSSANELAASMISQAGAAMARRENIDRLNDMERNWSRQDLEKQAIRRWRAGDVYAPHDLTGVEQAKWKKLRRKGRQKFDVVDQLGINPIHHYKNFSIMSEYMSDMGRIKHSNETGLRPVNQRRMAKAIRRAIGIGLMPGVHRHPEILRLEMNQRLNRQ